jgi:hypothetical protein
VNSADNLAEVEERRRPSNPGKRKATSPPDESDDGLKRAVKKLIRQAQLEADSPSNVSAGHAGTPDEHPGLSRSSSRERPVFDAYPMPQVQPAIGAPGQGQDGGRGKGSTARPPLNTGTGISNQNIQIQPPSNDMLAQNQTQPFGPNSTSNQNQNQLQNQNQNLLFPQQNQPFDSNNNQMFNFIPSPYSYQFPSDPTLDFPQFNNAPQNLDPAVESMLASYFPQPDIQNTQAPIPGSVGPEDFLSRVFSFGWNDPANPPNQDQGANGNGNGSGNGNGTGNGNGGQGMGDGFGFQGDWGGPGGGWMA